MKKCLLILILVVFTHLIHSQPIPPVKVADCPGITEVPVIDGLADEGFWSDDQTLTIFSLSSEADWNGDADFRPTMKFAWGWSYFYTYVYMTDEVDHSWDGTNGNAWEFDNVEWFFQLDTQTVPTTYTDNTIQMRFNRGDAGFQSSTFRSGITEEDFLWYSENTPDGWVVECAIPWTNIMPDGSLPEDIHDWIEIGGLIGFDLSCADSDGDDPLVGARGTGTQTAWDEDGEPGDVTDGTEDNAWNNTSVFGYLYLDDGLIEDRWPDSIPEAINEHSENLEIKLFPNPVFDKFYLTEKNQYSGLDIYSAKGELVLKKVITNSSIDVSALKPGIYIAVFDNIETIKFIKE